MQCKNYCVVICVGKTAKSSLIFSYISCCNSIVGCFKHEIALQMAIYRDLCLISKNMGQLYSLYFQIRKWGFFGAFFSVHVGKISSLVTFSCLLVLLSWENQKYSVLLVGIYILIGMQICLVEMHWKETDTGFIISVMVKRSSNVEQNQDNSLTRHSIQKRLWEKDMKWSFSVCLLVLWLMKFLWALLQMLASFISGGIASLISLCQHFWMQAWSWSKSSIASLDLPGS